MKDPAMNEPPPSRSPDEGPAERRARNGAWLMLVVLAAFAALALVRHLGY